MEEAKEERVPFDLENIDQESDDPYADDFNRRTSHGMMIGRSSLVSNGSNYDGIDQREFFAKVIAYLQARISQDMRGGANAREVDAKLD